LRTTELGTMHRANHGHHRRDCLVAKMFSHREICCGLERRSMSKEHASSPSTSGHQIEVSNLVRVTRGQARRLIKRFGKNRAKLSEAARSLKARPAAATREAALQ